VVGGFGNCRNDARAHEHVKFLEENEADQYPRRRLILIDTAVASVGPSPHPYLHILCGEPAARLE